MQQERPCPEVEISKFGCWGVKDQISQINCSEDLKYKWLQLSQAAPKWFDQPLHPWTGELHSFGLVQCKEGTKDCRSYGKTYRVPWWNLSKDVVAFLLLFFVEKVYKSRRLHYIQMLLELCISFPNFRHIIRGGNHDSQTVNYSKSSSGNHNSVSSVSVLSTTGKSIAI